MKNFLSKNWKRILILIAGIFIAINVVNKCMAPRTLIEEFGKYGPDVEKKNYFASGSLINTSGNSLISGENSNFIEGTSFSSPLTAEMTKVALFIGGGIIIALILTELANKKPSSGKKK